MRQVWILAVVAVTLAGCAPEHDDEVAAMWRHQDGTAVSSAEISEARTACVRASARELTPAETDFRRDPVFHSGGEGLIGRRRNAADSIDSSIWRNGGRTPVPLADCLLSRGLVRAQF